MKFRNCRSTETVIRSRDRRLLRRDKSRGHHSCADGLGVHVKARTGQFTLLIIVVLVKFVYSRTISLHSFAHREVETTFAEGLGFLVGGWRRRRNFFQGLLLDEVDVNLFRNVTTNAQ